MLVVSGLNEITATFWAANRAEPRRASGSSRLVMRTVPAPATRTPSATTGPRAI